MGDEKVYLRTASIHNETAGFNSLYLTEDYNGSLIGKILIFFVSPEHRDRGIAKALKDDGLNWFLAKGITKIVTEIDAKNKRMLDINNQAGFKIKSYVLEKELSQ